MSTEQPIDTGTAAGKCFPDMFGCSQSSRPTCAASASLKKARGVYKGRKPTIDPAKIKQMKADGMGPSAIAKALRIGRASVYRALEAN
jgi:DNA invertase Pin-like site-specific DNA recombinase